MAASDRFINCSCNHLTSFGGSLLVEPNPIDFDKVLVELQQLPETGNIAVIVAMAVVLLCYASAIVIVRKFDKEDAKNVSKEPDFACDHYFHGVCSPVHCIIGYTQDLIVNSNLQLLNIIL